MINNNQAKKDRILKSKQQREIEQKEFIADLKKKAEISKRFINDERHKDYKELLESAITYRRAEYELLGETVKDNDELIRRSLVLSTEIKVINWVLNTPTKFIRVEEKMNNKEVKE